MNNPETPIGANGKKELKVTKSNDADKLLDKYFEDLEKEGYGRIDLRALVFDVPEVAIKSKGGDEIEEHTGLNNVMDVSESGRRTFDAVELMNGLRAAARTVDLDKVKAKVRQLKEQRANKQKSARETEKPEGKEER